MPDKRTLRQRWQHLSTRDKRQLLTLALLLPLIHLSLKCLGLRRTRRGLLWASKHPDKTRDPDAALSEAERVAALASSLGQHGGHRTSCLRQALAVEYCLRRRGLPVQLQLGTRKTDNGELQAHAWVELQGQPLAQTDTSHQPIADIDQRLR